MFALRFSFPLPAGIIAEWRRWILAGFMPQRSPVRVRPLLFYAARMEGEVIG